MPTSPMDPTPPQVVKVDKPLFPPPTPLPSTKPEVVKSPPLDPVAGLLSFLIPGLGQIAQGRIAKGLLFFGCLWTLFFYGMALGQWSNVYIPDATPFAKGQGGSDRLVNDIYNRPHFIGQFWIGVAAWPAIYQYAHFDEDVDKHPLLGKFERAPRQSEINNAQRDTNKRWDLGWVYTVIAGVLNILVIYDAIAGPAVRQSAHSESTKDPSKKATA